MFETQGLVINRKQADAPGFHRQGLAAMYPEPDEIGTDHEEQPVLQRMAQIEGVTLLEDGGEEQGGDCDDTE
ncbi:hypothetical protein D3C73_1540820 [compost metagenome]